MSHERPGDETDGPVPAWSPAADVPSGPIPWPAPPPEAGSGPVPGWTAHYGSQPAPQVPYGIPPVPRTAPSGAVGPPSGTGAPQPPWGSPGWVLPPGAPTGRPFPAQAGRAASGPGPMGYGPPRGAPPGWGPHGSAGPPAGGGKGVLIALLVVVLALLAGGGAFWWLRTQNTASGADAASAFVDSPIQPQGQAEPTLAAPTPPSPQPTAQVDQRTPEQQALDELGALRAQSLAGLDLDGRWVAQVASKSVGITDPMQTAENGTHTFYAVDILAESQAAREVVADPSQLLVLQSIDFGKISTTSAGLPYWVTLVDAGFGSSDDVQAWCSRTYSDLSPAELANACAARTLTPPHA